MSEVDNELGNDELRAMAMRAYIAAGCETSPDRLSRLALSGDERIRWRVAENLNTPPWMLLQMANDDSAEVKLAVATNPNCPVDVTFAMAYDSDPTVRYGLAEDANSPPGVLKLLACDENPYVRCKAEKTIQSLERPGISVVSGVENARMTCYELCCFVCSLS